MLIYFSTFLIIICITYFIENNHRGKKFNSIWIFLCIFLLAMLAALRSEQVGIDVRTYLQGHFRQAGLYQNIIEYLTSRKEEYLYYLLVWLTRRFTDNIHVFFFIHQFLLATLVYIIAYKNRNNLNMSLCITAYLFLWYCSSYNIIRQSLAMIIMFYAYKYIESKTYIKYFLLIILAIGFHTSAFFCLMIPFIDIFINGSYRKTIEVISVFFFLMNFIEIIFRRLSFIRIFSRYIYYFKSEGNFSTSFFLVKCAMIVGIIFFIQISDCRKRKEIISLSIMGIFDTALYACSLFFRYGYRISYYFVVHLLLLIPYVDKFISKKSSRTIYRLFIVISFITYWCVRYIHIGYDGIYPYKFYWS